jgi:hypothetical protein
MLRHTTQWFMNGTYVLRWLPLPHLAFKVNKKYKGKNNYRILII